MMIRIAKSFLNLTPRDRRLVIDMTPYLIGTVVELKLYGFAYCQRQADTNFSDKQQSVGPSDVHAASVACRRVSNALGIGTCLSRSIATRKYLGRHGVNTSLRIGVRKPGQDFGAHAWLEYKGVPIGERVSAEYSVLPELK